MALSFVNIIVAQIWLKETIFGLLMEREGQSIDLVRAREGRPIDLARAREGRPIDRLCCHDWGGMEAVLMDETTL